MVCTLPHIVKRSVRLHLIAGFCQPTTSEQIFVVSVSFCGWRTNKVTTAVEGYQHGHSCAVFVLVGVWVGLR